MKLSELSLIRESVRDYSSKPVEADKLTEVLEPVVILPLGYPAYEGQRPKQRKAMGEIVEIR